MFLQGKQLFLRLKQRVSVNLAKYYAWTGRHSFEVWAPLSKTALHKVRTLPCRTTVYLRGAGGFSESSHPYSYTNYSTNQVAAKIPKSHPFAVFEERTQPSQACVTNAVPLTIVAGQICRMFKGPFYLLLIMFISLDHRSSSRWHSCYGLWAFWINITLWSPFFPLPPSMFSPWT